MPCDEPDQADHDEHHNDYGQLVRILSDQVPVIPKVEPEVRHQRIPDRGPQDRVDKEFPHIHFRHASDQGDQMPDHRHQPDHKHGYLTALPEPRLGHVQIIHTDQDVLPVQDHELRPPPLPDIIGGQGPNETAEGTHHNNEEQVEHPLRGDVPGERHDQLGGRWEHHTFQHHHEKNATVPQLGDRGKDETGDHAEEI